MSRSDNKNPTLFRRLVLYPSQYMQDDTGHTYRKCVQKTSRTNEVVSISLPDGRIAETLYDPEERSTRFCIGNATEWNERKTIEIGGELYTPMPASNNLIRHSVLLLPSSPHDYQSDEVLLSNIRRFINRYVDLTPAFEEIASYYVLLTWVYDSFNELPYLRFRGDYGSGKTRALLVVGSICYKPLFAGGASTVSPIFRMLDSVRGTLVIDEADFSVSDEKAEIIKILNNGNARGFPVLRSEVSSKGVFSPQAYTVYGPKLVATRKDFQDQALESRCLTEEMGRRRLRDGIPLTLPTSFGSETLALRNKLLLYRLRNAGLRSVPGNLMDADLEPRLRQVFSPLISLVHDERARRSILGIARRYQEGLTAGRSSESKVRVLETIRDIRMRRNDHVSIDDIRTGFLNRFDLEYDHSITHRWIGSIVRKQLHLETQKRNGVYVIPQSEFPVIEYLIEKYGIDTARRSGIESVGSNADSLRRP